MEKHLSEIWVLLTTLSVMCCFFMTSLYVLFLKYNQKKQALKAAWICCDRQSKEIEYLKKTNADPFDAISSSPSKSLIITFDVSGKITSVNDYLLEFFGFKRKELIGQNVVGTLSPKHDPSKSKKTLVEKVFMNPDLYLDAEIKNTKKDGTIVWVSWINRVIYDEKGKPTGLRAVGFDISARKKMEEKLKYLTSVDPATGILKRAPFLSAVFKEMKRSLLYERDMSLILIKFNSFDIKQDQISDVLDDRKLKELIDILQKTLRSADVVGRLTDLEFGVLLPETSADKTPIIEEKIKKAWVDVNAGNEMLDIVFSSASKKDENDNIDALLLRARKRLKKKK